MSGYTALRQRWQTPEGKELAKQVWIRLAAGMPLDDLGLEKVDGRTDLRGIAAPLPTTSGESNTYRVVIGEVEVPGVGKVDLGERKFETTAVANQVELRGVELCDLDFRGSSMPYLRFLHARVANCRFDDTGCREWKMWATDVTESSFAGANLAKAMLGGYQDGRYNRFERVDFTRANVAGAAFSPSYLTDCDFSFATVRDTEFEQASLVRCRFAGKLKSVIFDGRLLTLNKKPEANPMEDIDMSGVTDFKNVEFRAVNFDRVTLPDNPNLIVIEEREWIEWALAKVESRDDLPALIMQDLLRLDLRTGRDGAHYFNNVEDLSPDVRQVFQELLAERPPGE